MYIYIFIYKRSIVSFLRVPRRMPRRKFAQPEADTCPGRQNAWFHLFYTVVGFVHVLCVWAVEFKTVRPDRIDGASNPNTAADKKRRLSLRFLRRSKWFFLVKRDQQTVNQSSCCRRKVVLSRFRSRKIDSLLLIHCWLINILHVSFVLSTETSTKKKKNKSKSK